MKHLDVLVADAAAGTLGVLANAGDGTLGGVVSTPAGATPGSVAVGDLNADGWPDVLVGNGGAGTVTVLLGTGEGALGAPQTTAVATQAGALVITSDVAEHVHVHGFDLFADVGAGETATLVFEADVPGVFEVEFEDSFTFITELEVR